MLLLPYGLVPLALMERFFQRFPRLWIAPIFQLPITIDDMVTAPLQFFSHRGFAGARHAVDQIISNTHSAFNIIVDQDSIAPVNAIIRLKSLSDKCFLRSSINESKPIFRLSAGRAAKASHSAAAQRGQDLPPRAGLSQSVPKARTPQGLIGLPRARSTLQHPRRFQIGAERRLE